MSFIGSFCTSHVASADLALHLLKWAQRSDLRGVIQTANMTGRVLTGTIAGSGSNEIVDMACELRDLAAETAEFREVNRFLFQYGINSIVIELGGGKARVVFDDGGFLSSVSDDQMFIT